MGDAGFAYEWGCRFGIRVGGAGLEYVWGVQVWYKYRGCKCGMRVGGAGFVQV